MTCIVGIEHKNKVYIGGDSCAFDPVRQTLHVETVTNPKIFKKDNFIFGFTTSFRMGQILEHCFKIPKKPTLTSDIKYLCTTFTDELRNTYKKAGFATIENEFETGGTFLLGYNKRLYAIADCFQIITFADGYTAVGMGSVYALGALAQSANIDMTPEDRIESALEIAAKFCGGVAPPFHIINI